MALTKIGTDGVKDDAVTSDKLAANAVDSNALGTNVVTTTKIAADAIVNSLIADNAVENANIANSAVTTAKIADQAVTLAKLPHGDGSSDGKFLRANNGADPSFETVSIPAGTTINSNTNNQVITATGTANTLQGESKFTFDGSLVTSEKRMVIGNGTEFQIPSRSGTSSYTPQLQVTGAWNNPTHGGTLALNGRNDYPILWINSGASYANNSGSGTITFSIKDSSGDYCNTAEIRAKVDASPSNDNAPGRLSFFTTGTSGASPVERLRINSNGDVIHQSADHTYAVAYKNLSNSHTNYGMNSNGVLLFNTAIGGMGNTNQYNASNGRYTCPVKGFYLVQFRGLIDDSRNTNNSSSVWLYKNGSNTSINMYYEQIDYSKYRSVTGSSIIPCDANDYLQLRENGTGALHVSGETQMTISLYRAHL